MERHGTFRVPAWDLQLEQLPQVPTGTWQASSPANWPLTCPTTHLPRSRSSGSPMTPGTQAGNLAQPQPLSLCSHHGGVGVIEACVPSSWGGGRGPPCPWGSPRPHCPPSLSPSLPQLALASDLVL